LDGAYNASNMHVLVYVYDMSTLEIYQVIKQKIQ
jgi:Mor family transcriptional regulator